MKCEQVQKYLHAYMDGETGTDITVEIEKHLADCGRCRDQMDFEASFIDRVRTGLADPPAPPRVRSAIAAALDREDRRRYRARIARSVAGFAVAAGLVVVASIGIVPLMRGGQDLPPIPPIEERVVENVVKNPPLELQHADASRVRDWFSGKVSFAVEPPAFAGQRTAEFVGARLYNVGDSDAAYLVYDVDGRKVTIQMFRPEEGAAQANPDEEHVSRLPSKQGGWVTTTRGYTVGVFEHRGVTYSLTSSDLDEAAMAELIETMR